MNLGGRRGSTVRTALRRFWFMAPRIDSVARSTRTYGKRRVEVIQAFGVFQKHRESPSEGDHASTHLSQ